MDISPETLNLVLAIIAAVASTIATYATNAKNKANEKAEKADKTTGSLLDLMTSEKPMTTDQQEILNTLPGIEKTITMPPETENTVYKMLKAADPNIERGTFNTKINNLKAQKLLSYALIAGRDYTDETPNSAVFIEYGLIRSTGTAKEIYAIATAENAPAIFI